MKGKGRLKIFSIAFISIVFLLGLFQTPVSAVENIDTKAKAAIVIDGESGRILFEKNADEPMGIASMTKMMTEYLLLEAVNEGKVSWDDQYTVSPELSKMSHNRDLSNVPLRVEGTYSVKDLYQAMAIESANAATVAIAEIVAGTEAKFVEMMNEKAKELGLESAKFVNASGLNNRDLSKYMNIVGGAEEENVMSAKDVAALAFHLIHDFPEVLETSSIPTAVFAEGTEDAFTMKNWNWMLEGYGTLKEDFPNFQQFVFEGMDGLKTGSTDYAGYCFTGTAERNGQRFISVVMNTSSQAERFVETAKILQQTFNSYSKEEVIPKEFKVKGNETLPVTKGKEDKVTIQTDEAISLSVNRGEVENFKPVLTIDKEKLNEDGELTAPIKKGEKVGTLTIQSSNDEEMEFVTAQGAKQIQVDVVAAEDVEKANWFVLMLRGIGGFFSNLWGSITSAVSGWF